MMRIAGTILNYATTEPYKKLIFFHRLTRNGEGNGVSGLYIYIELPTGGLANLTPAASWREFDNMKFILFYT